MALNHLNLDARTREFMLAEIDRDVDSGAIFISHRLTDSGAKVWPDLLVTAVRQHNDAWLASELRRQRLLRETEVRNKPKGGTTEAKVPETAPETLAEGEFNRYYMRGVCARAMTDGIKKVVVYRARHSDNPRPESERMIGSVFDPSRLLEDLRGSPGKTPAHGVPMPNSGLSIHIP